MKKLFRGQEITNSHNASIIKMWDINKAKKVDDIVNGKNVTKWEDYFISLNTPFITTVQGKQYKIWKEQRAEHVKHNRM